MPAFVERARGNAYTAGATVDIDAGGTKAAGNALCLELWSIEGLPTGIACGSDNLTLVDSLVGADGYYYSVWEKLNIIGGGTAFAVSFAASTFVGGFCRAEISGAGGVGPILSASGTGTAVSEPFTTTQANGLAMALVRDTSQAASSLTAGSGYTSEIGGGSNATLFSEDLGAAASEDMAGTWNVSATWVLIGRVYYAAGGGGSTPGGGLAAKTAPIKSLVNGGLVAASRNRKIIRPPRKIIVPQRAPLHLARNFHNEARL